MWVKGAPDVLLARASHWLAGDGERPLDAAARADFVARNSAFAEDAMRVLALASRAIPAHDFDPAGDLMVWTDKLDVDGAGRHHRPAARRGEGSHPPVPGRRRAR